MKSKTSVRYFPFAPGIPWKMRGSYIWPELDKEIWDQVLKDKKFVIVANGGLFESFFSLSLLEALNATDPTRQLYWTGSSKYSSLAYMNGLSKPSPIEVDASLAKRYPAPIFLDKYDLAYFNCLNNYIKMRPYTQRGYKANMRPVTKQIFENSLLDWDFKYIPQLRKLLISNELEEWRKRSRFYDNKPFVLIFPDATDFTIHSDKCLNWGPTEVKAFSSMLHQAGYSLVVCTDNPRAYYDSFSFYIPLKLDFILFLLSKARAILSKDIDFLLMGLLLSSGKVIANPSRKRCFRFDKNRNFLRATNETITKKTLTPLMAYNYCLGLE